MSNEDPESSALKAIQVVQNNLMRTLNGSKIKDMVSIDFLLQKFKNQINASIKLLEIWKVLNVAEHPLKITLQSSPSEGVVTRASERERPIEVGGSTALRSTAVSDAIHIWNKAPALIQESISIYAAKKQIKCFVKTLPI